MGICCIPCDMNIALGNVAMIILEHILCSPGKNVVKFTLTVSYVKGHLECCVNSDFSSFLWFVRKENRNRGK